MAHLPINSMVDLSMANCECHNQMVDGFRQAKMINMDILDIYMWVTDDTLNGL